MKARFAALAFAAVVFAHRARADEVWQPVATPKMWRGGYGAVLLKDGRVAAIGGIEEVAGNSTKAVSIFDPKTKIWTAAAPMETPRHSHATVQLATGHILVAGGQLGWEGGTETSTAELYDPTNNTWTTVAPLSGPGLAHGVRLTDGLAAVAVLAASPRIELFDAGTRTWTIVAAPTSVHVAPLPGGEILGVVGGYAGRHRRGSGWTILSTPEGKLGPPTALDDGRVFVLMDSYSPANPAVFDPTTNTWQAVAGIKIATSFGTKLSDGRVLVAPGFTSDAKALQVFDPKTNTLGPPIPLPGGAVTNMIGLSDGRALATLSAGSVGAAYILTPPQSCSSAGDCSSGHCVDGVCCDSACSGQCEACDTAGAIGKCVGVTGAPHGTRTSCSPSFTPACRALTCDPTRSRTACVAPVFRPPCDCAVDADCPSGFCADGVCCNAKCDGQCEACDLPDSRGVCVPVVGEPRGVRKGCAVPSRSICSIQACDGVDRTVCKFIKGAETGCDSICGGSVQRHCDGAGLCGRSDELRCANECSIHAVEPARPRIIDAAWVLLLAASIHRARRRRS